MASGRPLDPESTMFFGYSIGDDFPFLQNAPEPAPGAPLLSDTEQNALHNWFDDMKSDDRIHDNITGNAIHSENWIDVPQFVGSSTSFGQPQDAQNASLGHHILPQDVFDNLPLMFGSGTPHMSSSRQVPQHMSPAMPSASRSNSSPALPLHMASGLGHSFVMPGGNLGIDQAPSDDVVAAANTLLLNGHHGTRHASFNYGQRVNLSQPHNPMNTFGLAPDPSHPGAVSAASPSALLPPVAHNNPGRLQTSPEVPVHGSDLGSLQASGLVFASDGATSQQVALSSMGTPLRRQELQWGTDQSFAQKQFTPRSEKETTEALMSVHFKSMECLAPNHSAGTTRPSSPTYDSQFNALNLKTRTASSLGDAEANGKPAMAPPRKRRKAKGIKNEENDQDADEKSTLSANGAAGEDDGEEGAGAGLTKSGKPRKRKAKAAANGHPPSQSSASPPNLLPPAVEPSSADGAGSDAGGTAPTKRRRSAALAKPPRENLTEEQKRENHIKSEQKRRTLIKTGFDDLCILVPGLQGGNLSKSLVLTTAASWLSELLDGNKKLETQLLSMPNTTVA